MAFMLGRLAECHDACASARKQGAAHACSTSAASHACIVISLPAVPSTKMCAFYIPSLIKISVVNKMPLSISSSYILASRLLKLLSFMHITICLIVLFSCSCRF